MPIPHPWLICASTLCASNAWAQAPDSLSEPFVAAFRLPANARSVEALAWRSGGDVLVARETLQVLGIDALPDGDPIALSQVAGLAFREIQSEAAIVIECSAACFARSEVRGRFAEPVELTPSDFGAFLNLDLAATWIENRSALSGAFELGLFGPLGFGELSWIAGDERAVRLETRWTIDRPGERVRMRIGDSITRGGASGVPFRFGGVQIARDFTLDPGFTPFPTPSLNGEAATPSTVDLYIDGALRLRERVDAGPFTIVDAPVVAGAGVARVVITDALGRQQVVAQNFYTNPAMLRGRLWDFSFAAGAERLNFGHASNDYGRAFAIALMRYGFSDRLTGEARFERADDLTALGFGLSWTNPALGQIDFALAASNSQAGDGALTRIGWFRNTRALSFGAEIEAATEHFIRLGENADEPAPALRAVASIGADLGGQSAASLTATQEESRSRADVRTLALSYAPPPHRWGFFSLQAFYVDDGDPFVSVGVNFSAALNDDVSAGVGADHSENGASFSAAARRGPPPDGGFGWRMRAEAGAIERFAAGANYIGAHGEADLEASRAAGADGLRGQYAMGFVWMDGALAASRPVRESFALVDLGAPHVGILRDRRRIGETNAYGRLLVAGLRPYETNRLGLEIGDLPLAAQASADEMVVAPAARSGVFVRFPVTLGAAGEARILDENGAPLPVGAMLVREADGARFPVGRDGRVYLTGLGEAVHLSLDGPSACIVEVSADALGADAPLICRDL